MSALALLAQGIPLSNWTVRLGRGPGRPAPRAPLGGGADIAGGGVMLQRTGGPEMRACPASARRQIGGGGGLD